MTTEAEHLTPLLFPCRHHRQQRPDRSLLPCAWPGCSKGTGERFLDRMFSDEAVKYERRVTGGGTTQLCYLWRVMTPDAQPDGTAPAPAPAPTPSPPGKSKWSPGRK